MGCATSKQKKGCRKCQTSYSPVRRSYSMHIHHPPQKDGDSYHLVALTSSTLGSLKLDPFFQNPTTEIKNRTVDDPLPNQSVAEDKTAEDSKLSAKEEFAMSMIEAKTWSNMIDTKIPKIPLTTPVRTPPGEPETIDAAEMMRGLDDSSPLRPPHLRSFSFHVAGFSPIDDQPTPRVKETAAAGDSPPPEWIDSGDTDTSSNSVDTSVESELDTDEMHPLIHPSTINAGENEIGKDRVVVYFTSLRGVRKTYEECCHVRVILKGLGVKVDERDVSMHSRFKEELRAGSSGGISLPTVIIGGKCVSADEIRRLNEEGMLVKLVEKCEKVDEDGGGGGGNGGVCEACGDVRFVPCETCSGSCKIYYEDEGGECGFQRCPNCNENGLVRCPICCN